MLLIAILVQLKSVIEFMRSSQAKINKDLKAYLKGQLQ